MKDFKPVLSRKLEFKIDDYKTAFVGRIVDYQNPNDPDEFVQVYYRQIALVSERAKENNTSEISSRDGSLSNLNYHRKQETDALNRIQQASDAFAYIQWRMVRDSRTGQNIRTGPMQIWLLDPGSSGIWAHHTQPAGTPSALKPSPLSEPSKADPEKSIIVGLKFTLENTVHIVRIDQDDILTSTSQSSPSKEAANEKK